MRTGRVVRIREMIYPYEILVGKSEGIDHLGDLSVNGRIKSLLKKYCVRVWTGLNWLRIVQ
jgi:hypothetical protein